MPLARTPIPIPTTFMLPATLDKVVPQPQIVIVIRDQEEDAWCYAACARMAIKHTSGRVLRQCDIAGFVKGDIICCPPSLHSVCTSSGCGKDQIELILRHWGVSNSPQQSFISLPDVVLEIITPRRPRLIEVVLDWDGTQSSHAVLIAGVKGQKLYVIDPLEDNYFAAWVTHAELRNAYGHGRWVRTWTNLRV